MSDFNIRKVLPVCRLQGEPLIYLESLCDKSVEGGPISPGTDGH